MSEIVHRINAPTVTGANMMLAFDAIKHRITHVDISGFHVDFGTKHHFAIFKFAISHALK